MVRVRPVYTFPALFNKYNFNTIFGRYVFILGVNHPIVFVMILYRLSSHIYVLFAQSSRGFKNLRKCCLFRKFFVFVYFKSKTHSAL